MDVKPLISIIVPVFNVEDYVEECIEAILSQTYSNLEIIIIDDGSSDMSGSICDRFAAKDARISIIHQANKGLSATRNTGIDKAHGEFILMPDSDDWMDSEYVEKMYEAIIPDPQTMFVNTQPLLCYENGKSHLKWPLRDTFTLGGISLIEAMLAETSNHYIHTKMFRKEVFDYVRFREGILDEDTLFTYELSRALESQGGLMIEIPLASYHYRQRAGSICNASSIQLRIDRLRNLNEIRKDIEQNHAQLSPLVDRLEIKTLKWLICDMYDQSLSRHTDFKALINRLRATRNSDAKASLSRFHYLDFLRLKYTPVTLTKMTNRAVMSYKKRNCIY